MSDALARHVRLLQDALPALPLGRLESWGEGLAARLSSGARLLVAGNGGSAAQAQHLTAELVGRYRVDRPAFSAIALHADTSSLTAVANDYGYAQVFARQVRAHGRPGDVLLLLSTSGTSASVLAAADAAGEIGLHRWALTGPVPNPLAAACEAAICVDADTAVVQEVHQVAVHLLCEAFDAALVRPVQAATGSAAVPVPARRRATHRHPVGRADAIATASGLGSPDESGVA